MIKNLEEALEGKKNYLHYQYDLSFKISIMVSFYTLGLYLCLMVPLTTPFVMLIFVISYYLDKYNLMYLYPVRFES
jgi:hypothetical protein